MKTIAALLLTLTAAGAFAAEEPKFNPRVSVDTGAYVSTSDFDDESTGVLLGLNARFTDHIGVNLSARAGDDNPSYVDRADANFTFRAAVSETGAITPYAGVHRNFESDNNGLQLGLRVDQKIFGPLGLFAAAEADREFRAPERGWGYSLIGGLNWAF